MERRHGIVSTLLFCVLQFGVYSQAFAAPPNVVGTFSGTLTGDRDACFTTPSPTSNSVTLVVTSQNSGNFSGTFTVSGLTNGGNLNGTVNTAGAFSATFSGPNIAGFSVNGTFSGSSLVIAPLGLNVEDLSMNCFELGGSLNFTGGSVIDPLIAPGTELKDAATVRNEVLSLILPVQNHILTRLLRLGAGVRPNSNGVLLEMDSGLNAGDSVWSENVGVWLNYTFSDLENDFSRTVFDADRHNVMAGVDISPWKDTIVGVALGYEIVDTDTTFNGGNLETDGYSIVPYMGMLLSDTWSVDANFGYSSLENEQFRIAPGTGARVTSSPDTDRWFVSGNLNGVQYRSNWILGTRLGLLWAENTTDGFTESNGTLIAERETSFAQWRIGGNIAYQFHSFEPYIDATYEREIFVDDVILTPGLQPANDHDDILFTTGVRFFSDNGMSGNILYSTVFLREDYEEDTFSATFRMDF